LQLIDANEWQLVLHNDVVLDRNMYGELEVAARRLMLSNGVRSAVFELARASTSCACRHDDAKCEAGDCVFVVANGRCVEQADGSEACDCDSGFSGARCATSGALGDRLAQFVYVDVDVSRAQQLVASLLESGAPFVATRVEASLDPATGLTVVRVYGAIDQLSTADVAQLSTAWSLLVHHAGPEQLVTHSLAVGQVAPRPTPKSAAASLTTLFALVVSVSVATFV
jgi:hypothetical protein